MRVTNNMLRQNALRNLAVNVAALQRVQEQVATTKRLNRPSDDPAQVRSAVKLRDGLAELEQYVRNADAADRLLVGGDTALGSAGQLIQRARELAVLGATATTSPADRAIIAREVEQLAAQLVQVAGTCVADTYVFSGYQTATPPYAVPVPPAPYAYAGDAGAIMARIAPGATLQVNLPGDAVFQDAFDALASLQAELAAGTPVSGATIDALDVGFRALLDARATLGARQRRLDETRTTLEDGVLATRTLLSQLEDVDLPAALSELASREATYQAALAVSARILQPSLMDQLG